MNIDYNLLDTKIFDTGGQKRFKFVRELYYRGTHGFFLTYDITKVES